MLGIEPPAVMKAVALSLLVLAVSVWHLDALLPQSQLRRNVVRGPVVTSTALSSPASGNADAPTSTDVDGRSRPPSAPPAFRHADIVWKVRPPPETPWHKRVWLRFAANAIRLDSVLKGEDPPLVLCPKGGRAVLEAYTAKDKRKIGRFGFTTERGPSAPPIQETVQDLYGVRSVVGIAAVIYMYVEPEFRKRNLGGLALQVISLVHSVQNCDFTVLVVDDDGSGKLIDWYASKGFKKAPKLQAILGSPDAVHGVTMIKPTERILPYDCFIQWW